MKKTKLSASMGLLAGLCGTAALWLPFYDDRTPFDCGRSHDWSLAILAWGGFAALPILISQVLRLLRIPLKKVGIAIVYFLSVAAMILPLVWISLFWYESFFLNRHSSIAAFIFISAPSMLIPANFVLLVRNLKAKREPELTCGVFLLGAYMANALLAMNSTANIAVWWGWDGFGVGSYLVLAASVFCIGSIVTAMSTRSKKTADTGG